jgi:hypothetical protein
MPRRSDAATRAEEGYRCVEPVLDVQSFQSGPHVSEGAGNGFAQRQSMRMDDASSWRTALLGDDGDSFVERLLKRGDPFFFELISHA